MRYPLFEISGETLISSTSGKSKGRFWLSLLPGELLVAGEVIKDPTSPERLSNINDLGLCGSGDNKLQAKVSKLEKNSTYYIEKLAKTVCRK